jgi:hypothetical protein
MKNRDSKSSWLRKQWRRYEESQTTVGVIFAGIAALFIAGIAAAFLYAKDTNPTQTASVNTPATTTGAPVPPIASAPETTGSGGGNSYNNYNPPKQDPRENEQMERPR